MESMSECVPVHSRERDSGQTHTEIRPTHADVARVVPCTLLFETYVFAGEQGR